MNGGLELIHGARMRPGDVITGGHPASDAAQGVVVIAVAAIWLAFVGLITILYATWVAVRRRRV